MALTRALAASGEQITNTERTVTSALTYKVKAWLPEIDDGSGSTVAEGYTVSVSTDTAPVEIVDVVGRRIAVVQPGAPMQMVAVGDATANHWVAIPFPEIVAQGAALATNASGVPTLSSNLPAGATTASSKWLRVQLPDGSFGLLAVWAE